jgi:hypothetical protein
MPIFLNQGPKPVIYPQMRTEAEDQELVQLLTDHQTAILSYIRPLMSGYPGACDSQQLTNITLWKKKSNFTPSNVPNGLQVGRNFPLNPSLFRSAS